MKDYSIVKVCSLQSNGGMVLSVVQHCILFLQDTTTEPTEFCQTCDSHLPLSELRRHVATCKDKQKPFSAVKKRYVLHNTK